MRLPRPDKSGLAMTLAVKNAGCGKHLQTSIYSWLL